MLIKVKTFTKSKKQEIKKVSEDNFEIKIKEKPLQGRANNQLIKCLADYFILPENKIRIVKGFHQRNKIFEILD